MRFEIIAKAVARVFANVAKHVDVAPMAVRIELTLTRLRHLYLTRIDQGPMGRSMDSCPWQRQGRGALCPVRVTQRSA